MAGAVTIQLAPGMRRYLRAYFLVMVLFVGVLGIAAITHGKWVAGLIAGVVVWLLGMMGWRWSSLAVAAGEGGLIVRQFLRTRQISRGEILSFRVGGRRRETPGVAVRALLRDGSTVVLGATGWYCRSPEDVEALCTVLDMWRRSSTPDPSCCTSVSPASQ
jgi:MFS family permease